MPVPSIILGGPGCGKTTYLLGVLEKEFSDGVQPNEIAFVAFTRKAAHEALDRAKARFGFKEEDLPYFRTLHSLAFRQLKLTKDEVLVEQDYKEIFHAIGLPFGEVDPTDEETGMLMMPQDDQAQHCLYLEQMARISFEPLQRTCVKYGLETYRDVKLYADTLNNYKQARQKIDFTDMLELFRKEGPFPDVKVVFIDEAQDLTPLQWAICEMLTANAERVYIAGDDDQAIYDWAGADVQHFLALKGNFHVLPVSHRLPRRVFQKASWLLRNLRQRFPKDWSPRDDEGCVDYAGDSSRVDLREGSWLVLSRNRYMLAGLTSNMREKGHPFTLFGRSSVDNDTVRAILVWQSLLKQGSVSLEQARLVYRKLREGVVDKKLRNLHGAKAEELYTHEILTKGWGLNCKEDWMTAIKMSPREMQYYRDCLRNGESLTKPPRIVLSTIHQVKGGEADHVLMTSDISMNCYRNLQRNPDSETRVFYVGATRARHSLHILHPRTNKYYEMRG